MPVNELIARRLVVRGRVQGVGYRKYIEYKAAQLGINGWVRNRLDGSVEAVVQGSLAAIAEIIECAKRGPRAAEVSAVEISNCEDEFDSFTVRVTE
jgi:acylphosphatase